VVHEPEGDRDRKVWQAAGKDPEVPCEAGCGFGGECCSDALLSDGREGLSQSSRVDGRPFAAMQRRGPAAIEGSPALAVGRGIIFLPPLGHGEFSRAVAMDNTKRRREGMSSCGRMLSSSARNGMQRRRHGRD
jgi:hypothetical protein